MLFLMFQLGTDRYAIDAKQVTEVLPLVQLRHLPHAPPGLAGIFDYHGTPVPLVDLSEIALGTPSRKWMSTRIILVKYPLETGKTHLLGILAERATETFRRPEEDFQDSGAAGACYLGPVLADTAGIVQRIEIPRLLPPNFCNQLFGQALGTL